MKIKKDLEKFYDQEAKKYYFSRKKYRSDGYIILEEIKKNPKKTISILEFGCGSGRFISFLKQNLQNKKINYIGVDLSKKLLEFAKKDNPKSEFIQDDIFNYIQQTKQESFDYIVGIASFQHIPSKKESLFLLKNFYRSLNYGGQLIMINWSFSKRFIQKYYKSLVSSILKSIYTASKHSWNDLYIPWKNKGVVSKRYYHIFTKKEIENLTKTTGFKTKLLTHVDNKGQTKENRKNSNNIIFIGEKNI
ncbi:MAG: class I SAM-dependent methyltransferase [Candidatus Absconditabacterales bacterium]|nr:class I SAM-dependent methyltransferase [Candidatus Absconditabacterales bacterium]